MRFPALPTPVTPITCADRFPRFAPANLLGWLGSLFARTWRRLSATRPVAIDSQFETQFETIVHNLQQQARDQRVFIKDFPWHIMSLVNETLLSLFDHTFLIRHPAQMIASYLAVWPDVQEDELAYAELAQRHNPAYPRLENSPRLRELRQTVLPYSEKPHAVRLPITRPLCRPEHLPGA